MVKVVSLLLVTYLVQKSRLFLDFKTDTCLNNIKDLSSYKAVVTPERSAMVICFHLFESRKILYRLITSLGFDRLKHDMNNILVIKADIHI